MRYRNRIPEPGTTISGFADSKKKNLMPNNPRFFSHVTINTHFFLSRHLLKLFYDENTEFFYLLCSQFQQKASG
jgi:hypothetical protein